MTSELVITPSMLPSPWFRMKPPTYSVLALEKTSGPYTKYEG